MKIQASFPVIRKVGKVGILMLLKSENKSEREINLFNFDAKHHEKCKFVLIPIRLSTVPNLFALEVSRRSRRCQFSVLQENSNG